MWCISRNWTLLNQVVLLERHFAESDFSDKKTKLFDFFSWKIKFLVLARITFKLWKISTFFSMFSCSMCFAQSSFYTGPARNCDVRMSHTWISVVRDNMTEIKAVIFKLFHLFTYNFARFGRFACFGGFGAFARFGGFVSAVSFCCFGF